MYHPFMRGKQYELITLRETASLLASSNFVPIIEPVKESLGGLERALQSLCDANAAAIVLVNPYHGDYSEDGQSISTLLQDNFRKSRNVSAGILLHKNIALSEIKECCRVHESHDLTLVHAGFTEAKELAAWLGERKVRQVFFEKYCGKLYTRHFPNPERVLVRDGFKVRRNRDHPDEEFFSDLHVTYPDEGMNGFGDFLIVGDEYSETGGPAYAIAIHITFIDEDRDDGMYIYHFKSKRQDTPTDPAGKFAEALSAMIAKLNSPNCKVLETNAVKEFRALHSAKHFPGLGYVKKLSMKHHIETLAAYLKP